MKTAQLKVMEMLESGKITFEEAKGLLEVLNSSQVNAMKVLDAHLSHVVEAGEKVGDFLGACGKKALEAVKSLEQPARQIGAVVVGSAAQVLTDIADNIASGLPDDCCECCCFDDEDCGCGIAGEADASSEVAEN